VDESGVGGKGHGRPAEPEPVDRHDRARWILEIVDELCAGSPRPRLLEADKKPRERRAGRCLYDRTSNDLPTNGSPKLRSRGGSVALPSGGSSSITGMVPTAAVPLWAHP
jgi:hypothetical protein